MKVISKYIRLILYTIIISIILWLIAIYTHPSLLIIILCFGFIGFRLIIGVNFGIRYFLTSKKIKELNLHNQMWNIDNLKNFVDEKFRATQLAISGKNLEWIDDNFSSIINSKINDIIVNDLNGKKVIINGIKYESIIPISVVLNLPVDGSTIVISLAGPYTNYTVDEITNKFLYSDTPFQKKESSKEYKKRAMTENSSFFRYYCELMYINGKWVFYDIHKKLPIFKTLGKYSQKKLEDILKMERSYLSNQD